MKLFPYEITAALTVLVMAAGAPAIVIACRTAVAVDVPMNRFEIVLDSRTEWSIVTDAVALGFA